MCVCNGGVYERYALRTDDVYWFQHTGFPPAVVARVLFVTSPKIRFAPPIILPTILAVVVNDNLLR